MPQIGWFEILIIVIVAIIIIGPKDFPIVLKKVGSWLGSAKRYINNFQNEFSDLSKTDFETNSNEINKNEKKDVNDEREK
tara:strand:+ start:128 stop:367 length:240 start_codon:yes stop_codon:yes gene_type:complete